MGRSVGAAATAGARGHAGAGSVPRLAAAGTVSVRAAKAGGTTAKPVQKKVDSAIKRAKQAEVHRVYNKSRRTQISTRMKKVFVALDALKKAANPSPGDLAPIEEEIARAYSIIDKAVKVGTIHQNTGAHRKSRIARAKRAVSIELGWYTPVPAMS
eukprot:SM000016S01870  [mRNA]  locus=s16:288072:288725:+ [translate_table: standard]